MARSRWGSAPSRLPARHAACNSRSIATRLDCRRRAGLRREGPVPLFGLARLSTKRGYKAGHRPRYGELIG
jgi:hypothetical protein